MKEKEQSNIEVQINLDTTPILYTDNVLITVNEDGVVLDVCQKVGSTNQARVVSRIGMSREHAKKLTTEFGRVLAMTEGKAETNREKKN